MKWTDREAQALYDGLEQLDFALPDYSFEKLNIFARELVLWNRTHGLISLDSDPVEIVNRHILDSLAALPFIGSPESLADVGSGAGFPGIPLAVCLPETKVTLIEKMGRRCGFLRNAVALAGLSDRVEIEESPVEKVSGAFDIVTIRAFAPIPRVIEPLMKIILPGGKLVAYKGKTETAGEELGEGINGEIKKIKVPGLNAQRTLVIIEKSASA